MFVFIYFEDMVENVDPRCWRQIVFVPLPACGIISKKSLRIAHGRPLPLDPPSRPLFSPSALQGLYSP